MQPAARTALDRFLPWALNPDGRTAWAPRPDPAEPDTTADTTGADPPAESTRVA